MIRIEAHVRGISITVDKQPERQELLKLLEQQLGYESIRVHHGSFIVPIEIAHRLHRLFTNYPDVEWDRNMLVVAESQVLEYDKQTKAQLEVAEALENPLVALHAYNRLDRLDAHQIEAVAAISVPSLRGLALFDEQGTGKTIISLAAFDRLRQMGYIKKLLVIAPKSVLASWRNDALKLFGETTYRILFIDGPSNKRRRALQGEHDILLMSYDGLVRDVEIVRLVVGLKPKSYMLVADESYFVKNENTERSKALSKIRPLCERAVVLCGTPAPNSAIDIVNQVNLADQGFTFATRKLAENTEAINQEITEALKSAIYLRRLKEDVFPDIPKKSFAKVYVPFQPTQEAIYARLRSDLIVEVEKTSDAQFKKQYSSFLAKRLAMLQVCSHPGVYDPNYIEIPGKQIALDSLLTSLIDKQGKKVVIWSYFRYSLEALCNRYSHYGVARIDGTITTVEGRLEEIRRFQEDANTMIFIGNAAAAGAGITLTAAHNAIYESFSNQAAHYMQSIDRIHRRGQSDDVTYYILLCEHSIEDREFNRLQDKEQIGHKLLGDVYQEAVTRSQFLSDLTS